jgi:hypothetical protein
MSSSSSIPRMAMATSIRLIGGDRLVTRARDIVLDYEHLPFQDRSVDVVIFDPPFQPQTVPGAIGAWFTKIEGGVADVKQSVQAGCREAWRVARLGVIIKVQDYIHDHKPVWMSMWIWEALGEPYDFVTLRASAKPHARNWTRQLSVRRNHSTFWIYRHRSLR